MQLKKHIGNKIETKQDKFDHEGRYTTFGMIQNNLAVQKSSSYKMAHMSNFKKAVNSVKGFNPSFINGDDLLKGGNFFIKGSGVNFEGPNLHVYADICPNTNRFKNLRVYHGDSLRKFRSNQ